MSSPLASFQPGYVRKTSHSIVGMGSWDEFHIGAILAGMCKGDTP